MGIEKQCYLNKYLPGIHWSVADHVLQEYVKIYLFFLKLNIVW